MMKPITGQYEYVFYHTGIISRIVRSLLNATFLGYAGKQTGHGFRHIASTILTSLATLGHAYPKTDGT